LADAIVVPSGLKIVP